MSELEVHVDDLVDKEACAHDRILLDVAHTYAEQDTSDSTDAGITRYLPNHHRSNTFRGMD